MARYDAPHPVALSDVGRLTPAQAETMRRRALHRLRTARGQERRRWAQTLLLADSQLGHKGDPDFEDRLQLAREAIGRVPSNEDERVKQEVAEIRAAMQGSPTPPDVAARAHAVRLSMEDSERDEPFERRLAAAKRALGRA
jgi:hypothetical protein